MLSENIRVRRRAKGLSQEELAWKLNVVRQTVSKWEKGMSVPDSEMLIKIADCLGVSVSVLLGETEEIYDESNELKQLAVKLEALNNQFAKETERRRMIWRTIFIIIGIISAIWLIKVAFVYLPIIFAYINPNASIGIIGGSDEATSIIITRSGFHAAIILPPILIGVASITGIVKTKRK